MSWQGSHDVLPETLRNEARVGLARGIETEVVARIDGHARLKDEDGRRQVVRNVSHPEKTVLTGLGAFAVKRPWAYDRRPPEPCETATRTVLPSPPLPEFVARQRGVTPDFQMTWVRQDSLLGAEASLGSRVISGVV